MPSASSDSHVLDILCANVKQTHPKLCRHDDFFASIASNDGLWTMCVHQIAKQVCAILERFLEHHFLHMFLAKNNAQ